MWVWLSVTCNLQKGIAYDTWKLCHNYNWKSRVIAIVLILLFKFRIKTSLCFIFAYAIPSSWNDPYALAENGEIRQFGPRNFNNFNSFTCLMNSRSCNSIALRMTPYLRMWPSSNQQLDFGREKNNHKQIRIPFPIDEFNWNDLKRNYVLLWKSNVIFSMLRQALPPGIGIS